MYNQLSTEHRLELQKLELYNKMIFEFNDGWFDLIYTLGTNIIKYCSDSNIPLPTIKQIKEKFGTLRFYYIDSTRNTDIRTLVQNTELKSEHICENCGELGMLLIDDGKWFVACDKCTTTNAIPFDEWTKQREQIAHKQRICDICDINGVDKYWTGELFTTRCVNHKGHFITENEYFETRNYK